ncbi:heterokaryon incompatibility protein-domain-containing protein [Parachaetomium inaequale]|uniref:Heterokaryon incompatibility protein-domain-containing protein n=1 Tax=Parachaetomium inaequale TaxID=2588326 RepID=A0AAN6SLP7_9PEZI|nr:heterokaryon incompatibility protein-domain-containing protein [Parachaetomium inaequale]
MIPICTGCEIVWQAVKLTISTDIPNPWKLAGCLPSTTSTGSPATALPTRILDLGAIASSQIALRETEDETGRYLCLSYCWGTAEFLKTTRDNLERHKQGIKAEDLPQTLQDAIHIARFFGVRYVWIDALCIIQHDEDNANWERESGRMVDVYRNSYLTVAATWADSAHGSCFKASEQDVVDLGSVTMRRIHHFPQTATPKLSIHFPLLSRAWGYQERILSPRVVHFGRQEILRECHQRSTCECGSMTYGEGESAKKTFHETISEFRSENYHRSPQHTWRQMVVQYSPLQLTYATDKLPAFSGLADEMQHNNKQDYLAGLWRDTLILDMCWYRNRYYRENTTQTPYVFQRAPSWSWASVDGPVRYHRELYHPEVLDAQCSLAGPSLTGHVTGGFVELRCSMIPAHVHDRVISVGSHVSSCWIPDRRCGMEEEGGEYYLYYFIPMATAPTYESNETLIGLLVEPISPEEFIRIGLIVGLHGEDVRDILGVEKGKVRIV